MKTVPMTEQIERRLTEPPTEPEQEVTVETAQSSGWVTVVEYVDFPGGVKQPVKKTIYVGYFGRTSPSSPINNNNK